MLVQGEEAEMTDAFPFSREQLQQRFEPAFVPSSFIVNTAAALWINLQTPHKQLAVLAPQDSTTLARFGGTAEAFAEGYVLKLCPPTAANAHALRTTLPHLQPTTLGLVTSVGFGDRLGLATPGHVRALQRISRETIGSMIAPIFAQQSIREMACTGRTPQAVLDDATWGAFQAGWNDRLGADGDRLKTPADIDAYVAAGYTFYTFDPSDCVAGETDQASPTEIQRKVEALPWQTLESTPLDMQRTYAGRVMSLGMSDIRLERATVWRAAAKYGRVIAHVTAMYRHLAAKGISFELEVSLDKTEQPTTYVEHVYLVSELKRLGVELTSFAPRYVGRFESGAEYIGDPQALWEHLSGHALIARALGPYKLSLHSGSNKHSVYPIINAVTRGIFHLKTTGASYLEALRVVSVADLALFRQIVVFARKQYQQDKAAYHVSAEVSRVPEPTSLPNEGLPLSIERQDARQVLQVTYEAVLNEFGSQLISVVQTHEEAYFRMLEEYFIEHGINI